MLCSTGLFIDWGNSSNNLSDYISRFGETQLPVVPRTSFVNLVTGLKFKLVLCKCLEVSMLVCKHCTPDHRRTYYSLAIRKAICVLKVLLLL